MGLWIDRLIAGAEVTMCLYVLMSTSLDHASLVLAVWTLLNLLYVAALIQPAAALDNAVRFIFLYKLIQMSL